jgi:hypothetical protein
VLAQGVAGQRSNLDALGSKVLVLQGHAADLCLQFSLRPLSECKPSGEEHPVAFAPELACMLCTFMQLLG